MMKYILKILLAMNVVFSSPCIVMAVSQPQYVDFIENQGSFCLAQKDRLATLFVDSQDYAGVVRAVKDLQADIKRVTNRTPKVMYKQASAGTNIVIVGTIGKSPSLID